MPPACPLAKPGCKRLSDHTTPKNISRTNTKAENNWKMEDHEKTPPAAAPAEVSAHTDGLHRAKVMLSSRIFDARGAVTLTPESGRKCFFNGVSWPVPPG